MLVYGVLRGINYKVLVCRVLRRVMHKMLVYGVLRGINYKVLVCRVLRRVIHKMLVCGVVRGLYSGEGLVLETSAK